MPPPIKKPAGKVTRIRVRAVRTGYYNEERKRAGAVFLYELSEAEQQATLEKNRRHGEPENDGLPAWIERVATNTPLQNLTGQQVINEANQAARDERMAARAGNPTDQEVL